MTPNADFPSDDLMRSDPAVGARHNGHDDVLARVVQGAHETIDRVAEQAAPHMHRHSLSPPSIPPRPLTTQPFQSHLHPERNSTHPKLPISEWVF